MESELLDFGIRNTAQGIRNPTNNLESRIQVPLTETGIEYPESTLWNPQSKTLLDSLTCVEILLHKPQQSIPELAIFKLKMKLTVLFEECCVRF